MPVSQYQSERPINPQPAGDPNGKRRRPTHRLRNSLCGVARVASQVARVRYATPVAWARGSGMHRAARYLCTRLDVARAACMAGSIENNSVTSLRCQDGGAKVAGSWFGDARWMGLSKGGEQSWL